MDDSKLEKYLDDFKAIMKVLDEAAPLAPNVQAQISMYIGMCDVFLKKVRPHVT